MPAPTDQKQELPPPSGDSQRAESYVNQLANLISQRKLTVVHTDLSRFDPSSIQDHYQIGVQNYQIEISHSKQPLTGRDLYLALFNNITQLNQGEADKQILAYLILSEEQFKKLKALADEQIETMLKLEEEKRFRAAMDPIDAVLDKITKGEIDVSKPAPPVPEIPDSDVEPANGPVQLQTAPTRDPGDGQMSELTEPAQVAVQTPPPQETAPPPSLEEVRQAITKAQEEIQSQAQQFPEHPPMPSTPPPLGDLSGTSFGGINTLSDQPIQPLADPASIGAGPPKIDQAIDQAFQPLDNSLLGKPQV